MKKSKKKLILIDSNALIHRAYHALPPLSKKDGTLTNAVYGYALTLFSVLEKLKPDYVVATFDLKGPTFRHEKYADYKATRKKADDELYAQIPMVKELLKAFNIPIYELQSYEADDVIGTIAKEPKLSGKIEKIIVTGDLDTLQLVDDDTKVFTLRRGITDTVIYDEEKVKERYGLEPWQMIEYKALRGDQSDNIPGVKGIGEKTAIELLLKYETVEKVYENLEYLSSQSVRNKLVAGKESATMSRELATINTNVPIDFDLEKCQLHDYDKERLLGFLKEMEFYSLAKKLSEGEKDKKAGAKGKSKGKKLFSFVTVETAAQVRQLVEKIKKEKEIAFDLAISADKFTQAQVFGASIFLGAGEESYFVPRHQLLSFAEILGDESFKKIGYNVKIAIECLRKLKNEIAIENFWDVQIAAYLLKSGADIDFEKLVFEEFGNGLEHQIAKKGQTSLLGETEADRALESSERAVWIFKLYKVYEKRLGEISKNQSTENKQTLKWVFEELELPLVEILAQMEIVGIKVNKESFAAVSSYADKAIKVLEAEIYKQAGVPFNINSPGQLSQILYEKLKIPTFDIRRGKTSYSTDAEQLRKVRDIHPIIKLVEDYRELFKVKSTYTDALPLLVEDDGRIHARFNQAVAATGRLSSSEPNLQNIPKRGRLAKLIRQSFVSEAGYSFVSVDYSQIDLRVAAHLSNDPRLVEAFQKGKDIHRSTAAWVNGISEEEVTDRQRSAAKSLNFGVLYGMGVYGFMRDSGLDRKRAESFIEQYMKQFSSLKDFLEQTKASARETGYVETELGRRRYIPNMNASNHQIKNAAERMAINLPVQGLAADIMKLAMVEVDKKLLRVINKGAAAKPGSYDAAAVLQIHDELIFEVKDGLIDEFSLQAKEIMENVYRLRVPLGVEVSRGKNWADL